MVTSDLLNGVISHSASVPFKLYFAKENVSVIKHTSLSLEGISNSPLFLINHMQSSQRMTSTKKSAQKASLDRSWGSWIIKLGQEQRTLSPSLQACRLHCSEPGVMPALVLLVAFSGPGCQGLSGDG